MSAWDDDGSEEDEFDLIETPPTVHSVTVNSSGTRIAVAHSKGATIYSLFAASPPGASPPPADQPKPFAPKILLKLDHRHLCTASGLPERAASNGASSDDDNEAGRRAAGRTSGTADSARSAAPSTTGVGMVALLYETNVLALVGGGEAPCQPPNRVLLFNGEYEQQRITLLGPVAQVILRNRRVIALAQTMLTVHSFTGEKLLEAPATGWAVATPVGRSSMATWSAAALGAALAHMSAPSAARSKSDEAVPTLRRMPIDATNVDTNAICAFPDSRQGGVSFCNWLTPSLHTLRIVAHQGDIDGIALTPNGEGLITASDTNTVIRVWTVATGAKLRELRLGSQPHATFVRSLGLYSLYGERPSPQPSSFCPDFAVVVDSRGEVKFFYVGGSSPNDSTQSSEVAMAPTPGGGNSPHPAPTPAPSSASGSSTAELAGKNQASRLSTFQFMSSYFASEWHCTSLTLPHLSITSGSSPGQSKSSADAAVMPSVMPITGLGWFEITTAAPPLLPSGARAGAGGTLASAVKPVTANNAPQQMLIHVLCVSAVNGVVSRVQFNASTGKCTLMGSQQFE